MLKQAADFAVRIGILQAVTSTFRNGWIHPSGSFCRSQQVQLAATLFFLFVVPSQIRPLILSKLRVYLFVNV
jgi:hypothetical protein